MAEDMEPLRYGMNFHAVLVFVRGLCFFYLYSPDHEFCLFGTVLRIGLKSSPHTCGCNVCIRAHSTYLFQRMTIINCRC